MYLNKFLLICMIIFCFTINIAHSGLTEYGLLEPNLTQKQIKETFKKFYYEQRLLTVNPNRASTFHRVGTLLNHYDTTMVETEVKIDSELIKFIETFQNHSEKTLEDSYKSMTKIVNDDAKKNFKGLHETLQNQFSVLSGRINNMIQSIKFYESPEEVIRIQETKKGKKKKRGLPLVVAGVAAVALDFTFASSIVTFSNLASAQASKNKQLMNNLENKINKVEEKVRIQEEMINETTKQYKNLVDTMNILINTTTKLYGQTGKVAESIDKLFNITLLQTEQIKLLGHISEMNTFIMFLQEILDNLDVINSGDVTIKPILYHLADAKNKNSKLKNILHENYKKENLAYTITEADLINRYLITQYSYVKYSIETGVTVSYKSIFLDFRDYNIPLMGIYAVNQYMKLSENTKKISEIYMADRLPDFIAVDPNVEYFIPMSLREYEICVKSYFVVCPIWFNMYRLEQNKCVEQLFYFNITDSKEACNLKQNTNVYDKIVQLSYNEGWDIIENKIIRLKTDENGKNCTFKEVWKKGFSYATNKKAVCVNSSFEFKTIDVVKETRLRVAKIHNLSNESNATIKQLFDTISKGTLNESLLKQEIASIQGIGEVVRGISTEFEDDIKQLDAKFKLLKSAIAQKRSKQEVSPNINISIAGGIIVLVLGILGFFGFKTLKF